MGMTVKVCVSRPGPSDEPVWTDKNAGMAVSVAAAAEILASLAPPATGPVAEAENAIVEPVGDEKVSNGVVVVDEATMPVRKVVGTFEKGMV
jgi:hypothetical protein